MELPTRLDIILKSLKLCLDLNASLKCCLLTLTDARVILGTQIMLVPIGHLLSGLLTII